jgi:glutamate-1-semialdehyde 2,1-aminomutase
VAICAAAEHIDRVTWSHRRCRAERDRPPSIEPEAHHRSMPTAPPVRLDRARLAGLLAAETERFRAAHPRSLELHERAKQSLLDGVPMNWMSEWASPFPLFVDEASGASFRCVDGHEYVDFCLGDTGAMAGHGATPTVAAVERQMRRGITHMLPTEDALVAGEELRRRFGLPLWQFTITATDANRFALRLARQITGRSKIVVHDHCYHGSVDESFATLDPDGRVVASDGIIGPPVDLALTTRVVPFNDIRALEAALADEAVAAVLVEPALTNVGIVLPEPGYHDALRELTRRTGTVLIIDETHTICAGPGGMTGRDRLEPDMLVIGKTIGGGIPVGTYGMSDAIAERVRSSMPERSDIGGVGGTLAGYALSLAAVRATLGEVLTDEAFARMIPLGERWEAGVNEVIASRRVPWHVTRLGARAEYHFMPAPPRDGAEQAANSDPLLEKYLHLAVMNRGVLMTPFHNMALMSPATTAADVDRHTEAFAEAVDAIVA